MARDAGESGAAAATAVALGWPTKYSHFPVEQSDTKDIYALSRICTVLAKDWYGPGRH